MRRFLAKLALCALVTLIACPVTFARAFADEVVSSLSSQAKMQTNGTLRNVEQRTFSFDEPYAAITWSFMRPEEASEADPSEKDLSEIVINSVRAAALGPDGVATGEWASLYEVSFDTNWRDLLEETMGSQSKMERVTAASSGSSSQGVPGIFIPDSPCYSFDSRKKVLYVFFDATDGPFSIECDYSINKAIRAYDDVAELYWDYVCEETYAIDDVEVAIQLPVPSGAEAIIGENVLAWGHGPEGEIVQQTDGVLTYVVSHVPAERFAQMHVVFPVEWLGHMPIDLRTQYSGTRYGDAYYEEQAWSDTESIRVMNTITLQVVGLGICIALIMASLVIYAIFGREPRPRSSKAKYWNYSPTLMGRLMHWNHASADDLVASILSLERLGVLNAVKTEKAGGGFDVRLRLKPGAKNAKCDAADQATMQLLFDVCGEGYQSVTIDEVLAYAKKHPDAFLRSIDECEQALNAEFKESGLCDARSRKARKALLVMALACVVVALGQAVIANDVLLTVVFLVTAVVIALIADNMLRLTQLGANLDGQMRRLAEGVLDKEVISRALLDEQGAYLYTLGLGEAAYKKCLDPSEGASVWFAPRPGRGGKPEGCIADQVSAKLEEAVVAAQE